jgi:hypothetical protein
MTPEEANLLSLRATREAEGGQEAVSKDLLEESRTQAVLNLEKYHRDTQAWRDRCLKPRAFPSGSMVLRLRRDADSVGKFDSKWEGPYIIRAGPRPGSYSLIREDGQEDPHSWNADRLMRYFP